MGCGLAGGEFRNGRLDRLIEQAVEHCPRVGPQLFTTLIARLYLWRSHAS
jgi:hypothetical protein